jgi:hypothetical protein
MHRYQVMFGKPLSAYDLSPQFIIDSLDYLKLTDILPSAFVVVGFFSLLIYSRRTLMSLVVFGLIAFFGSLFAANSIIERANFTVSTPT